MQPPHVVNALSTPAPGGLCFPGLIAGALARRKSTLCTHWTDAASAVTAAAVHQSKWLHLESRKPPGGTPLAILRLLQTSLCLDRKNTVTLVRS
jgi:hypothetical protein